MILVESGSAMDKAISNMFKFDLPGEIIVSLGIMIIMIVLSFVVFFLYRHRDPMKKPRGFYLVCEFVVDKADSFVEEVMGPAFAGFGGYVIVLAFYIFLAFTISVVGLPSPATYLAVPLSLGLCSFGLIHAYSIKFTHWRYFKRYVDPFPVFLPINLLSMWSPLLSLTFRLFGNAISGWVIMSLMYWALESASTAVFGFLPTGVNSIFFAPIITPWFHLYFDLFSGFIQTLVFMMLTMLFIAQEKPDDEEAEVNIALVNGQ